MSFKELLGKLGRGMRIAVEGRDLVLKIDSPSLPPHIKKDEDKIRGSVKAIVQSTKISCASFHDLFHKTKIKNGKFLVCIVGR